MEINQLCWDFTEIDTELWTGIPSDAYTKKTLLDRGSYREIKSDL